MRHIDYLTYLIFKNLKSALKPQMCLWCSCVPRSGYPYRAATPSSITEAGGLRSGMVKSSIGLACC